MDQTIEKYFASENIFNPLVCCAIAGNCYCYGNCKCMPLDRPATDVTWWHNHSHKHHEKIAKNLDFCPSFIKLESSVTILLVQSISQLHFCDLIDQDLKIGNVQMFLEFFSATNRKTLLLVLVWSQGAKYLQIFHPFYIDYNNINLMK